MKQEKWYAIRKGRKTGVFSTWKEASKHVTGVSGSEYKSFPTKAAADAYVSGKPSAVETKIPNRGDRPQPNRCWAFIDGSYDVKLNRYGYGGILIYSDHQETFYGGDSQPELAKIRNVAGEMSAAMRAVQRAYQKQIAEITLYYDYMGIEAWATGSWQRKNPYTQQYHDYMQKMAQGIRIVYVKVPAHTGVYYNEQADQLAKKGVYQQA
ncbi:MAG: ribonuclease H family protein [Aerococcus sp.]|nr:ribonuclease H family protein [Aerococcus sp.]